MKKRNIWRALSASSLMTAAVVTVVAPQAQAAADDVALNVPLRDDLELHTQVMTFEVFAKIDGQKADKKFVTVTNNGEAVPIEWDDYSKTSYRLTLKEGQNKLVITVDDGEGNVMTETRYIEYIPAAIGKIVGHYVFSMDAFVTGLGYLVEPMQMPIVNGDNAAHHVKRALEQHNFEFNYTGDINEDFYLGRMYGGTLPDKTFEDFPEEINELINEGRLDAWSDDVSDGLGEFKFAPYSGWMYAVNNSFPNVGFSDYFLIDGDVMRIQFTLNMGLDISGGEDGYGGAGFFESVTKDALLTAIANVNSSLVKEELLKDATLQAAYTHAYETSVKVAPTQLEIDGATTPVEDAFVEALNTLIKEQQHKALLQKEIQHLPDATIARLDSLSMLNDDAYAFEQAVNALPATITAEELSTIPNIRQQYDAMEASTRVFIHDRTVDKLLEAEAQLEELLIKLEEERKANEAAASVVINTIAALPTPVSLADAHAVEAAHAQYSALTEAQQAFVTNKDVLDAALTTIATLQAEKAANEAAALQVEEAIDALPITITLANAAAVAETSKQFDALTAVQQALVANKEVLDAAKTTIATLQAEKAANEAAAQEVVDAIAALPVDVTLDDAAAVAAASAQYDALTAVQQALVSNKEVLEAAIATITTLQAEKEANEAAANAVIDAIAALPTTLTLDDATAVKSANNAFLTLTAVQQALVSNKDVLDAAVTTIATLQAEKEANEAAAKPVIEAIAALPETIALKDAAAVTNAATLYEALTAAQQAFVLNKDVLDRAKATIEALQAEKAANEAAAKPVIEAIAALPATITLQDEAAVQAANEQFAALTATQQALVANKALLTTALETIAEILAEKQANEAAAQAVMDTIAALPAPITLQAEATVQAAKVAFELLTDVQKSLVANKNVLDDALQMIASLQTEAEKEAALQRENEAIAQAIVNEIAALPTPVTLLNKKAVQDIATKVDRLTDAQRVLVTNLTVLTEAQATIEALEQEKAANDAAAQAVINAITTLPEAITLNEATAVNEAQAQFAALTDVQQALVANKDVLDEAVATIATLQAQQAANEAAAQAVIDAIAALPQNVTLDNAIAVQNARTKWNALTSVQQALVANKHVLDAALATIEALQAQKQADEAAAKAVENIIAALPTTITLTHATVVKQAETKYAELTAAQQALVPNKDVLDAAQATIATLQAQKEANEAAAKVVIEAIHALPANVTLNDATAVQDVVASYTALTDVQQALVANKDVLDAAQATITKLQAQKAANEAAAKTVIDAIAALPTTVTLDDAAAVQDASTLYYALTKAQQAPVSNKDVLDAALATIATLQVQKEQADALQKENEAAAKTVIEAINALPATITLNDLTAVEDTLVQYEKLTDVQQTLVSNKEVLDAAVATIATLQAQRAADEAAAKAVREKIAALPTTITLDAQNEVQDAQVAFQLLTEAQQALVTNQDVLDNALQTLANLQSEVDKQAAAQRENEAIAKAVSDVIAALPTAITLADAQAVADAQAKYDSLTDEQQKLVSNNDVLEAAKQTIAQLQAEKDKADALQKANEAAAKVVIEAIHALPKTIALKDASAINAADKQFTALTKEQQALVLNQDVLEKAKQDLQRLQQTSSSGGGSYVPSIPSTPAPTKPVEPATPAEPEVEEPETPEEETAVTPEEQQPEATPVEEVQLVISSPEAKEDVIFTSVHNVTFRFSSNVAGTVARLHVKDDSVQFAFAKDEKDVILSEYVEVKIPQDVLSPKDGVLVQRLADGSVVAVPHRLDENGEFVLQMRAAGEVFVQNTKKEFKDIEQDGHKQYIEALAERLIVNGTTADTFSPKATMTRGQFAAMLQRSLALPKTSASTFKDTDGNQFAYELQTLVDIGVLKGDGDLLRPKDHMTRKHAALMIARLLEHLQVDVPNVSADDVTFTDKAAITPDALEAVALMQKLQIFSGKEDGRFDPNAPLTRSQMAKVLYQTLQYVNMM